jgi:hypothetical protein
MNRERRLVPVLLAFVSGVAGCDSGSGIGASIRVRLGEGLSCTDFCVDTVGAELRATDLPISLGRFEGPCGQEIRFDNVPAGVRIRVSAWAGRGSERVLEGESQELTVVAGDEIPASVALKPSSQPTVSRLVPDPIPETTGDRELAVDGEGFGEGAGLSRVELDGIPLATTSWSATRVTALLPAGSKGRYLRLRACGVGSVPMPLRMLAGAWKTLEPAGCTGLEYVDVEPMPGHAEIVLAAACDTPGESYLQRFRTTACDLAANRIPLPGRPTAVAALPDASAVWVGLEAKPALVRVGTTDDGVIDGPDLGEGVVPIALAAPGDDLYAVVALGEGRSLLTIRGDKAVAVPGVAPDLILRSVTSAPGKVLVPARDPQGLGKLVVLDADSGLVTEIVLPDCAEPDRIAVGSSGEWAAVTCTGGSAGILGLRLADPDPVFASLSASTPTDVALDATGDVAFAWTAEGKLVGVSLKAGGTPIASWTLEPSGPKVPLARFPGDQRMLLGGPRPGSLTILSPYAGQEPCGDGGAE